MTVCLTAHEFVCPAAAARPADKKLSSPPLRARTVAGSMPRAQPFDQAWDNRTCDHFVARRRWWPWEENGREAAAAASAHTRISCAGAEGTSTCVCVCMCVRSVCACVCLCVWDRWPVGSDGWPEWRARPFAVRASVRRHQRKQQDKQTPKTW